MSFIATTALKKLLQMKKKIRDVRGSTGAGKTVGIMMWDIDFAQSQDNQIIDVVSESYPHLDQGVTRDFKNIMIDRHYWDDKRWNETHHFYTFETGSQIHFQSYDKLGKAHGPRRDVLHLNEANYLPWNVVDQLITRTRKVVWAEYNPSTEFWMHEQIIGKRVDVESLKLIYSDNEGLTKAEVDEIESHRGNKSWWRVYGEGELGEVESMIYKGWKQISEIPHEARLWRRGLDFGYTNDPTVIEDIYEYDGGFILDESLYQKGLSNKAIFDKVNNMIEPQTLIIADSAEPKSIDELSALGLNIIGATKGQGSVYQGIQFVQAQKISITERSVRTIKAYKNYIFATDRDGKILNVPDDSNHEWSNPMDSIRYGFNGVGTDAKRNQQIQRQFDIKRERIARESAK